MEHEFTCPYCLETVSCWLDPSIPEASYTEDCTVCCNPMVISYRLDGSGELDAFTAERET